MRAFIFLLKCLVVVLFLVILSNTAFGQGLSSYNPIGNKTTETIIHGGLEVDSFFILPMGPCMLTQYPKAGRMYYSASDSSVYYCTGYQYIKIISSASTATNGYAIHVVGTRWDVDSGKVLIFTDTLTGRYLETQFHAAATYQPKGNYTTLTSFSASNPIQYNNTTGAFTFNYAYAGSFSAEQTFAAAVAVPSMTATPSTPSTGFKMYSGPANMARFMNTSGYYFALNGTGLSANVTVGVPAHNFNLDDVTTSTTSTTGYHKGVAGNVSFVTSIPNADLANSGVTVQGTFVSLGGSMYVLNGTGYPKMTGTTIAYNATIPNADLANSSINVQGTSVALGGSVNPINGTGIVTATGTTITYDSRTFVAYSDTAIAASYTLTSRDLFRRIHCTNSGAINVTIASGLGNTFTCDVRQEAAGNVTFVASSTTLYFVPTATTKTKQQGSAVFIGSFNTANSYTVQGDLQ